MKTNLTLVLLLICACTYGQYPGTLHKEYKQHNFRSMRYGLFIPNEYAPNKKYPLLIYLHGSRDTVSRDSKWYQDVVQKTTPLFVLTPKCTEPNLGWGSTWSDEHTLAAKNTLALLDSLMKVYNIDRDRLYIYGISMGGFGTFSILAKNPDTFAGAYAVCGGSSEAVAPKIKTPLWIFHGTDDDVVPVRLSRNIYNAMIKIGSKKVKYTEYPGVKHNSWENVDQEKDLIPWLLSQHK